MEKETNTWFLIKEEWKELLEDLTIEQRGLILSKLYGMDVELPGLLKAVWLAMHSELSTINQYNEARREKARKAANARWNKEDAKPKEADAKPMLKDTKHINVHAGADALIEYNIIENNINKNNINKNNIKDKKRNKDDTEKKIDYAKRAKELFQ